MIATLLLSLQMMAGLFLLLLGGVGFIQDKRFFSSAPAQTQAVVPASKPERFPGQHENALLWNHSRAFSSSGFRFPSVVRPSARPA